MSGCSREKKKARQVVELVKGRDAQFEAPPLPYWGTPVKEGQKLVSKVNLKSAVANASITWSLIRIDLYVADVRIDEGPP